MFNSMAVIVSTVSVVSALLTGVSADVNTVAPTFNSNANVAVSIGNVPSK